MAVGMAATTLADKWLNMLSGTAFTTPPGSFIALHTNAGDPGAAGTAHASSVTTRVAATWSASATGSKAMSNTPTWASWAGTSGEIVSYISEWDAITTGNFQFSATLTTPKTLTTGDTLTLSTLTFALTPIAA
jgi:hypothetical protein